MLNVKLNKETSIAILEPDGALTENDFKNACKLIDPYIAEAGDLHGLIIYTESFPGWDSFAALITHLKFIKEHHQKISSLAFVTNSPLGDIIETIGRHFIKANIKEFSFDELEQANNWIINQASK